MLDQFLRSHIGPVVYNCVVIFRSNLCQASIISSPVFSELMITYTLLPACSPKSTFIWNKWMHLTYFNLSVFNGCYQMFVHKSIDNLTLFNSRYLSIKIIINQSSKYKNRQETSACFDRWVRYKSATGSTTRYTHGLLPNMPMQKSPAIRYTRRKIAFSEYGRW